MIHLVKVQISGKLEKGKSHDYREVVVFENLRFQKCFPSTQKRKASVFKFLRFEERLQNAPFS